MIGCYKYSLSHAKLIVSYTTIDLRYSMCVTALVTRVHKLVGSLGQCPPSQKNIESEIVLHLIKLVTTCSFKKEIAMTVLLE